MSGLYGSVEYMQADPAGRRPMPKFLAPVILIILAGCACVLAASMYRADQQMSQDLYAFQQDAMHNKHIVWDGNQWVDEQTGKPVALQSQRLQTLLARGALTEALAAVPPHASAPNYNCCYVPKVTNTNGGVEVAGTSQLVESGMFCHMMIKNKPSTEWPMIRMGSLREAGVTTDDNTGIMLLKKHELHHCKNDIIFMSQTYAVLANSHASLQMLSQAAKASVQMLSQTA